MCVRCCIQFCCYIATQPYMKQTIDVPDIIPSLDRALYHWDGDKLQQLPFTADDLIDRNPFLHRLDSALAGSKSREVVGINIHTGEVCLTSTIVLFKKQLEHAE